MRWSVEFSPKAERQIKKLDKGQRTAIYRWMYKNIEGCENPRAHGHALAGNLAGLWRYRVGKYRVICELQDDRLVVLAIEVGHRSRIYER